MAEHDKTVVVTEDKGPDGGVVAATAVKPGWRTSEFLGLLSVFALAVVEEVRRLQLEHPGAGPWALFALALASVGYAYARARVKAPPPPPPPARPPV